MATMLSLRRRIKTAQNVSKTTKAMQMIAASKLKKAQDAAVMARPYVDKLSEISKNLSLRIDKEDLPKYMKDNNNTSKKLFVVIAPDKGLCGALVSNLLKEIANQNSKEKDYYIVVGKKAENAIISSGKEVIATFSFGTSLPPAETIYPIAKIVDEYFLGGKVSEVKIISTKFQTVFTQVPLTTDFLPINLKVEKASDGNVMLFEPNLPELLPSLLQHYLEMILYQSLLESYASEQGARMIAMKNATDNALDVIEELRLEYNKSRQERITNEILDISSSAFAYAN